MGVNRCQLIGHVGSTPEIHNVNDTQVAKFSLATSESYKDKNGEKQTTTEWHNLVIWRGLAKVVEQYIKKGSQLYVEGKITYRSYEKDGVKKYYTEIVVSNLEMLGKPNTSSVSGERVDNESDDLPW